MAKQKQVLQQLQEAVREEKKKEKPKKRTFRGFKATLRAEAEGLAVETEVRYAKIDSRAVDLTIKIVSRQKSTKEKVRYGFIGDYHKGYIRLSDGKEVPKDDVEFLQELPDGKLVSVDKFTRTKILEIVRYIPLQNIESFLIEARYEIWTDNIPALWKFAEWLRKNDKAAICRFSFGNTFTEYYALLHPHIEEGNFVILMDLTRMNIAFKHTMPITDGTVKAAEPKRRVVGGLKVDF